MSATLSLPISRPLLHWLRQDAQWATLPLGLRASAAWRAGWGSVNAALAAGQDQPAQTPLPADPVFIVGPWRSGTTAMHELLSAATGAITPLTWQCMNPSAFSWTGAPQGDVTVARPMDGLAVHARSPQEDEFALLALGAPSAYRAFLMPHRLAELHGTLDPAFWQHETAWLPLWERFVRGVLRSAPAAQQGAPLLLKSPNHSYRLPAIVARFPQARLLWMARPAAEVFHSNRTMWRAMFKLHGLTAQPDEALLDAFLTQALDRAAEALQWLLDQGEALRWVVVDQAELAQRPAEVLQAVLPALALAPAADGAPLAAALATAGRARPAHQGQVLLPAVAQAAAARLDAVQQQALRRRSAAHPA